MVSSSPVSHGARFPNIHMAPLLRLQEAKDKAPPKHCGSERGRWRPWNHEVVGVHKCVTMHFCHHQLWSVQHLYQVKETMNILEFQEQLFYLLDQTFLATSQCFLQMTCDPRHSAPGRKRMNKKEQARKNFTSAACSLESDLPNQRVVLYKT